MVCLKFRRGKKQEKPNFFRRMTSFGRGSPSQGRHAMLDVIRAALAGNLKSLIGVDITSGFHQCVKKHVRHVYDASKRGDLLLTRAGYDAFLAGTQGVSTSGLQKDGSYTFDEFFCLWSNNPSAWRAAGDPKLEVLDATRPFSNYFISSSHNTYLEGNQLSSKSSAQAYRAVLRNGCRCIEIDVWNGPLPRTPSKSPNPGHRRHFSSSSLPRVAGDTLDALMSVRASRQHSRSPSAVQTAFPPLDPQASGTTLDPKDLNDKLEKSRDSSRSNQKVEPVVHHHGTMTSTVGFREVCQAIKESAFEKNPLPIIVSLEVGADKEQQEVMVDIMKEEWAGLLLDTPVDSCNPRQRQPRLEELYNKILIKVKRLDDSRVEKDVERGRSHGISSIRAKPPICEALARLAIYTHSEHYEDESSLCSRTPSHIFSLSEDSFLALAEDQGKIHKVLTHNRDFFMRIYPKGLRVDSSNPDPSFHWRRGVQMVAMNWQKTDEGMMLNDGMFDGTNGWVLKPRSMLSGGGGGGGGDSASDASSSSTPSVSHRVLDLRITVLAGQFLPLPKDRKTDRGFGVSSDAKVRPKIKVELHVEKPNRSQDYARETAAARTDNPDWGLYPKSLDFLDVRNVAEELSFVRFKVEDTSRKFRGELIAWACIRLDRLQVGYRCVDLVHPHTRRPCDGKLFVKIEKVLRD